MHWALINTVLSRENCLLAALLTTDPFILLFSVSLKALLIAFKLVLVLGEQGPARWVVIETRKQQQQKKKLHLTVFMNSI